MVIGSLIKIFGDRSFNYNNYKDQCQPNIYFLKVSLVRSVYQYGVKAVLLSLYYSSLKSNWRNLEEEVGMVRGIGNHRKNSYRLL